MIVGAGRVALSAARRGGRSKAEADRKDAASCETGP
jgi:hypothetical protein